LALNVPVRTKPVHLLESNMSEPVDEILAAEATSHLTQLLNHLTERGLHTRLLTQQQRLPRLRVINPEAATLTEVISASPVEGAWWFWWSWAERITPVHESVSAAERIHYVLTPANCSTS